MTNNLYGIGTKFYGKDDIRPDGSFIATKWIVLAYIPIVPLGSFYVRSVHCNAETVSSSRFLPPITQRMGWQKRHILNMYAFMGGIAFLLFLISATLNYRAAPITTADIPARISEKGKALSPSPLNPNYTRPTTAENGSYFPNASGYITGYEQRLNSGGSAITINNTGNTSDLYAKLYSLDRDFSTPARVFFVKAESRFTVDYLDFGNYELRYKDLDTGGIAKTEELTLAIETRNGQEYFGAIELTLSKVLNGNLKTEPILEKDF